MQKRWISLLLVLALVLAVWSVCAVAADAVSWAYAADLLTEKDGKLHVADELTRKELTRMLEDFLDLI